MKTEPLYTVGQTVHDLPSERTAKITKVADFEGAKFYTLDKSVPLDATGDGAFPNRNRLASEICLPADAAREQKQFSY